MADTYNIGMLENDTTNKWKERGYEVFQGQDLIDQINQAQITTIDEEFEGEDTPDLQDVRNLGANEEILVLTQERTLTRPNPERPDLEEDLSDLQEEVTTLQSDLRQVREQRREEVEDLEGLQGQLSEVREELDDINQEFRDLGLTPPIISTEEVNQLPQQDQQRARELLSRRGQLNNQIGELNTQVEEQQQVVNELDQEVDNIRERRNDLQEQAEAIQDRIEDLEPETIEETVLLDIILICTTEWETYIAGRYRDPTSGNVTRIIEGQGTKSVRMGSRAPIQIRGGATEEQFWDEVYSQVKEQVFRNPGATPEGEWIDRLIDEIQSQPGPSGQQGVFTGSNWEWSFGPASGTHEFPEQEDFEDEKDTSCDDWTDVQLRS